MEHKCGFGERGEKRQNRALNSFVTSVNKECKGFEINGMHDMGEVIISAYAINKLLDL